MRKIIRLRESDLTRIVKRVIREQEEENEEGGQKHLSSEEWVEIWFKLRKMTKSFHFPDYGFFTFGGLFFYYDEEEGCLKLPPQKLSDWREDTSVAADILDDYAYRIQNYLNEFNSKNSNLRLELKVGSSYSMKMCAY
jgi:hypothetical protein